METSPTVTPISETKPKTRAIHADAMWILLAPAVLLVPLTLSGAIRVQAGLSLGSALALGAVLLGAMVAWIGVPRFDGDYRARDVLVMAVVGSLWLQGLLFKLLYNPDFHGMVNTTWGVDTGNHADIFVEFVKKSPDTYGGFIGLYATYYWLAKLFALKTFGVLRLGFYWGACMVPLGMMAGVLAAMEGEADRRARTIGAAIAIVFFATPLLVLIGFPLLHYHQADGFLTHLFGFFSTLLLWLVSGFVAEWRSRVVLSVLLLFLQRYSYGENFSDLLLTMVFFWAPELWRAPSRLWRAGYVAGAAAAVYGAYLVFRQLWKIHAMDGFFMYYAYGWIVPTQILSGLVLLIAPDILRRWGVNYGNAALRLLRFGGSFLLINALVQVAFLWTGAEPKYYFYKYGLYAAFIFLCSQLVLFTGIAIHLVRVGPRVLWNARRWVAWFVFVNALIAAGWLHGFAIYDKSARERALGKSPYGSLNAFYDDDQQQIIDRVIKQRRERKFGGYFSAFWPRAYFMNVSNGQLRENAYLDRAYRYWNVQTLFHEEAGRCYFWEMPFDSYKHLEGKPYAFTEQMQRLLDRPVTQCELYTPRWSGKSSMNFCHVCL